MEPDQRGAEDAPDLGEALVGRHPFRIKGVGAGKALLHEGRPSAICFDRPVRGGAIIGH